MASDGEMFMDYNLKQIKNVVLGNLYYFDEINSTNEIALQTKDAPNGSLFFANKQLKGRGRMKCSAFLPRE